MAFAAVFSVCSLIKAIRERDSTCQRSEGDSLDTGRERTCVTVQSANAQIQRGSVLIRCDRADNIARDMGFLIARLS